MTRTKVVTVRLTDQEYEFLSSKAKGKNISKGEALRDWLKRQMEAAGS